MRAEGLGFTLPGGLWAPVDLRSLILRVPERTVSSLPVPLILGGSWYLLQPNYNCTYNTIITILGNIRGYLSDKYSPVIPG